MFVFNENIKNILESKDMTLNELAEAVGVHYSTLSKIFSNTTKSINLELAFNICRKLDISLWDLIVDDGRG